MEKPYGAVMVSAEQSRVAQWSALGTRSDPTPDDARAFRILNPSAAPPSYLTWVRNWTGMSAGY